MWVTGPAEANQALTPKQGIVISLSKRQGRDQVCTLPVAHRDMGLSLERVKMKFVLQIPEEKGLS